MSIPANIIAALCAKANDAAFANEISIATDRVAGNDRVVQNDHQEFIASLCAKASTFHLEDNRSTTSQPQTPRLTLPQAPSHHDDDCGSHAGSVSTTGHNIAEMQPQDMIAFARSIVTSQDAEEAIQHHAPLPPITILTSRVPLDEASTTSSLTDGVDRVRPARQILDSVSTDDLLKALGKKLSGALNKNDKKLKSKIDRLINDEVATTLAVSKKGSKDSEGRGKSRRSAEKPATRKLTRSASKRRSSGRDPMSPRAKNANNSGLDSVFTANSPTGADDEISIGITTKKSVTGEKKEETIPSDEDLLAIGWKKALDAASGKYYYYTVDRDQVVWENPLVNWFSLTSEDNCFDTDQFDESQFEVNPFTNKTF
jgi:hypothetical protein